MTDFPRHRGRFAPTLPLHDALDLAAQVIRRAATQSGSVPERVTKGAYERARAAIEGAPRAEALRQRLGKPWPVVVKMAIAPVARRGRIGAPHAGRPDGRFDTTTTLAAMRAARNATGSASAAAYDSYILGLPAPTRRRLRLPSASAIAQRMGSWSTACQAATTTEHAPALRGAPSAIETLDAVITATGLLPGRGQLEAYCRAHDIPLGRDVRGWDGVVTAVRARRAARGETTPATPTPARQWPALPEAPAERGGRRRRKGYSRAEALASLRRYAHEHWRPGEPITEKRYRAACARDPKLVPSSALARHGRFQDLVTEAGLR